MFRDLSQVLEDHQKFGEAEAGEGEFLRSQNMLELFLDTARETAKEIKEQQFDFPMIHPELYNRKEKLLQEIKDLCFDVRLDLKCSYEHHKRLNKALKISIRY